MRYADLKLNDATNGEGICVSYWTQGCPHRCHGCHNPQTWDFNGGKEDTLENIIARIDEGLDANGIKRNFSILGGEPLCAQNIESVSAIIQHVRDTHPDIKIYVWTGATLEQLAGNPILKNIDVLIDGPYIEKERDIRLKLRGSRNQRILYKGKDF